MAGPTRDWRPYFTVEVDVPPSRAVEVSHGLQNPRSVDLYAMPSYRAVEATVALDPWAVRVTEIDPAVTRMRVMVLGQPLRQP